MKHNRTTFWHEGYAGYSRQSDLQNLGHPYANYQTLFPIADFIEDDNSGTSGDDVIDGTDGDDVIDGGAGDDIINGGLGDDRLYGSGGRDVINGGDGDDYIADGWGTGTMDGGDGIDTVDVSHANHGAVIDLVEGVVKWNHWSPDETAINFENVVGSGGNDMIIGTDGVNRLEGGAGNDVITGGTGDDVLVGGIGNDAYVYNLGDGSDVIIEVGGGGSVLPGRPLIDRGDGSYTKWQNPADIVSDAISTPKKPDDQQGEGSTGDFGSGDKICFGEGIAQDNITVALSGSDLIITLPDDETITLKDFETNPIEMLEFSDGSTQDLSVFQSQSWVGRRDTWFSTGRDTHFGGEGRDTLDGRSGHDTLYGAGGDDTIEGGSGDDHLYGGAGDDVINGGKGKDTIFGDSGDDWISGGYGVDHMDGGAGIDTLDYGYSIEDVDIDLSAGNAVFASGSVEITTNFENVIGSQGDNVITGTSGDNTIDGGAGDDLIKAGAGNDRLKGGSGANIFEFSAGDGIDIIDDFDPNTDTLRISGAGNDSIIIEYLAIGTLITYGRDDQGNPVDQIFLVGVKSGDVTYDDIEKPDVEYIGTNEADDFEGTQADDVIKTFGGDDNINSGDGNDDIEAGDGNDYVYAGKGNDVVDAGDGADTVWLNAGDDVFIDTAETGAAGSDEVHGGTGDDRFYGAGGDDVFYGDGGSDTLFGGAGNDTLVGDDGKADGQLFAAYYRLTNKADSVVDIPVAEADGLRLVADLDVGALATEKGGDDSYYGVRYTGVIEITMAGDYTFTTGSDDGSELWIDGDKVVNNDGLHAMAHQSGTVHLEPGTYEFGLNFFTQTGGNLLEVTVQGPDTAGAVLGLFDSGLLGDAGRSENAPSGFGLEDVLNGGAGDDLLTGGSGADIIELNFGDGIDTMTDFEDGLDIIDLSATGLAFVDLVITDSADGTHITYETDGDGNAIGEIILTDTLADDISEEDFHFV